LAIFRIFDRATVLLREEKAVRQALIEADDLTSLPLRLPLRGAEAAREVITRISGKDPAPGQRKTGYNKQATRGLVAQ